MKQQRSATDPEGQSIRTVYPGPLSGPAQRISSTPQNETPAAPPPPAAAPALASSPVPTASRSAPPELSAPQMQADSAPISGATMETGAAPSDQPAPVGPGADLN